MNDLFERRPGVQTDRGLRLGEWACARDEFAIRGNACPSLEDWRPPRGGCEELLAPKKNRLPEPHGVIGRTNLSLLLLLLAPTSRRCPNAALQNNPSTIVNTGDNPTTTKKKKKT